MLNRERERGGEVLALNREKEREREMCEGGEC